MTYIFYLFVLWGCLIGFPIRSWCQAENNKFIESSGSKKTTVTLECKRICTSWATLDQAGAYGTNGSPSERLSNTQIVNVKYKNGSGFIPRKLLGDLLNPCAVTVSDGPSVLENHKVDWVLLITGGGGGEAYFANFGFKGDELVIRVIYGMPGGPPLAKVLETTTFCD